MQKSGELQMSKRRTRQRIIRFITAAAVGGSVFQLGACDPTVRSTLLTGLATTTQALTNTLITTFFQSLQDSAATGGGTGLTTGNP
jgi:hypothetical protein